MVNRLFNNRLVLFFVVLDGCAEVNNFSPRTHG